MSCCCLFYFGLSRWLSLVPIVMLDLAATAEMHTGVISCWAGCCGVFFCKDAALLCLHTLYYYMAIVVALAAWGHVALTMEYFPIFHNMVMQQAFLDLGVCLF